ncbi:MAG TPA: division/cell wall cluster transcriptional repressor MraZ [Bacilli bacterium]|jgi:MraZ protein|nr:division/cell wall cluster transcriptional repressor MraZ [Acholeplasmataceae bacterium]HNZ77877.1 division/cell wall cluster transcriptional repressor MraZ [Bacilli bacterium]HOD60980.1 division/cell wall cluster transcriptional repressor MraZ [Bacilli bacterium]HOE06982.1 division/cell wall cluster transcriptional repressor MraZ [Bacilli bacterium]HOH62018.1 division/cell wall cluster transcriptional repressor MraZ [Bacilli bacterium]
MFIGQYRYNLDEKGRLVIPQEFRKQLNNELIINKGIENCITIYKLSDWEKLVEKITNLPFNQRENRLFSRYFLANAYQKELDNQGRINIDTELIKYSGITKECVIIGAGNVIEIWAKDKWEAIDAKRSQDLDDISENLKL